MKMSPAYYRDLLMNLNEEDESDGSPSLGIMFIQQKRIHRKDYFDFVVLCKDPSTGDIFDAFTDETIDLQEDVNMAEMDDLAAAMAARDAAKEAVIFG